jgi:hypothetical protein
LAVSVDENRSTAALVDSVYAGDESICLGSEPGPYVAPMRIVLDSPATSW